MHEEAEGEKAVGVVLSSAEAPFALTSASGKE
jgi:hypothetical protein